MTNCSCTHGAGDNTAETTPAATINPHNATGVPVPTVVFVCVKNGGKSQIAAAAARHIAGSKLRVLSAGTAPGSAVSTAAEAACQRAGFTFGDEYPKRFDPAWWDEATRVVIIGDEAQLDAPEDARVERWLIDEPSHRGIDGDARMDRIRDEIYERVCRLVGDLTGT